MAGPGDASVAVVLVDHDDHSVSPAALDAAVAAADHVSAQVYVVDGRATVGRAWMDDERVVVLPAAAGASSTALRLIGVRATTANLIAFVDARVEVDQAWLSVALSVLESDHRIAAVSAAVTGVGEPTLSISGNVGAYHPVDDRRRHQVLYPVPEAFVTYRSLLDDLGLAEGFTWSTAVVDFGWRATIGGRLVVLDPAVRAEGRCSCRADGLSGLAVIHACLDDSALTATLPAAMVVAAARDEHLSGPSTLDQFVGKLPELQRRRAAAQVARVVGDDAVLPLLIAPLEPARREAHLEEAHRISAERHRLGSIYQRRQRVLVVTPDILTDRLAGPAIRAWNIASALAARHRVHLASTASRCERSSTRFEVSAPDEPDLRRLSSWADVVVLQGFAMEGRPYLRDDDHVMIVDLYDPLHLEHLELFRGDDDGRRRLTVRGATRVLNEQLVRGDLFVCASTKQRDFWLGQLAAVGRVNHLTYDDDARLGRLLSVVPFGLPEDEPVHTKPAIKGVIPGIGTDDDVILWGGGIYNWFDPLTLIRAVDRLKERRPSVRLLFMGLRHPNPEVTEMRVATEARRLARELGLVGRYVFFNEGWVAYDERQNFLLEADVGVSTHFDHLETEFSFRTRVLDYIWAVLPIVTTTGDWFAHFVESEGLGMAVAPEDVGGLEEALYRLLVDGQLRSACRTALIGIRPLFTWPRVLEPLVQFCAEPRQAPDRTDPEMRTSFWAPDDELRRRWRGEESGVRDKVRSLLASL